MVTVLDMTNKLEDRLLTVREVAEYLGYSRRTIYDKVAAYEIPHIRLDSTLRFRKSEIDHWIILKQSESAA